MILLSKRGPSPGCLYVSTFCKTINLQDNFLAPHRELRYQIKLALNSGTRQDVAVRIEIPFDPLVFAGGLQQAGVFVREYRGHSVYTIAAYGALSHLLGQRWHIRGLNCNDFLLCELRDCSIPFTPSETPGRSWPWEWWSYKWANREHLSV